MDTALSVERAGLTLTADASFSGSGGEFTFDGLTLSAEATAGVISFSAEVDATTSGLTGANLSASVSF